MNKFIWILIIAIVVIVGAWFAYGRSGQPTASEIATTTPEAAAPVASTPQTVTVTYTDQGFSPATVNVAVGDTVRFVNQSTGDMWVGADEHPTHTSYDGTATRDHCADGANTNGSFDQCTRTAPGTAWSYTFTKAGSFDYHNHARASAGGTVVVQ